MNKSYTKTSRLMLLLKSDGLLENLQESIVELRLSGIEIVFYFRELGDLREIDEKEFFESMTSDKNLEKKSYEIGVFYRKISVFSLGFYGVYQYYLSKNFINMTFYIENNNLKEDICKNTIFEFFDVNKVFFGCYSDIEYDDDSNFNSLIKKHFYILSHDFIIKERIKSELIIFKNMNETFIISDGHDILFSKFFKSDLGVFYYTRQRKCLEEIFEENNLLLKNFLQ